MDRLSVAEAAARLGMTEDGVRKRIHRNQIEYELDEDRRYFVYLDLSDTREDQSSGQSRDELVGELRDRIHFLENELSRERDAHGESRRIVVALVSRVPELEAPREMRESPVTDKEEAGSTSRDQQEKKDEPRSRGRGGYSGGEPREHVTQPSRGRQR